MQTVGWLRGRSATTANGASLKPRSCLPAGLTLIHLDSNKKVFSAALGQLESMETGEDAPAGSR